MPKQNLLDIDQHEHDALAMAVMLETRAGKLLDDPDSGRIELATASSMLTTAHKYRAEAVKLALARAEREYTDDLVIRARELGRPLTQRGPGRPSRLLRNS